MAFLDIINTYAKVHIIPGIVDNVFKHSPLLAYMRKNNVETFPGGSAIQENFRYAGLKGGSYAKGGSFDVTKRQTDTGMTFMPKQYYVNVTEFLEDINVYVKGPEAPFKMVDSDMNNASDTMAAYLAIALYQNGQYTGYTNNLNGLSEIVSDGTTAGWDALGASWTTYGTITRYPTSGTVGAALNATVENIGGAISYGKLETNYRKVSIGSEMPNIGVTTNLGMSYIVQKFQPQQRVEGTDPNIGFNGIKFNGATMLQDQYCPGTSISATNDPIVTAYMSGMGLTYPTMAAETFFWLNTKFFKMYITNDPLFGFGFTGFKRQVDSTVVAGQYLFAGNIVCASPRLQAQLYGITG